MLATLPASADGMETWWWAVLTTHDKQLWLRSWSLDCCGT